jgi:hypothetical protein
MWFENWKQGNLELAMMGQGEVPVVATVAMMVMMQFNAIPPALLPVTLTNNCVIGLPVGEANRSSMSPIAKRRAMMYGNVKIPETTTEPNIARGMSRAAFFISSDMCAAASYPTNP